MDWSNHFETHELDMLLGSDKDKNKEILIENCRSKWVDKNCKFVNIHEGGLTLRL
jgi:hypothetical protein